MAGVAGDKAEDQGIKVGGVIRINLKVDRYPICGGKLFHLHFGLTKQIPEMQNDFTRSLIATAVPHFTVL